MIDPIRGSIWQSNVNSAIGLLFVTSVALWAGTSIIETAWHINPVSQAFAAALSRELVTP